MQELDSVIFRFLWDEKPSKIKKNVVIGDYISGGLKMTNVFTFLSTMKISWLRKLFVGESTLQQFIFNLFPDFSKLNKMGVEYTDRLINRTNNPFWTDVLKHYSKLCQKNMPTNIHDFNAEFIFYNTKIKRGKRTVFIKDWFENEIYHVSHLLNEEGILLDFPNFKNKFPNINADFLTFNGLTQAIKKYQKSRGIQSTARYRQQEHPTWICIYKGNREVLKILNDSSYCTATGVKKWNRKYHNLEWNKIFKNCIQTSSDVQLRWLQTRIIHRILPTNRYLFLRKGVDSPLCSFCGREEETIPHLMWNCSVSSSFWLNLENTMKNLCMNCSNLQFSEQLILFGVQNNVSTDKTIDLIIMMAKLYLYKCKWNGSTPLITAFLVYLKHRYTVERYLNTLMGRADIFQQEWFPYVNIVN